MSFLCAVDIQGSQPKYVCETCNALPILERLDPQQYFPKVPVSYLSIHFTPYRTPNYTKLTVTLKPPLVSYARIRET